MLPGEVERTVLTLPFGGHEQDVNAMLQLYDNAEELTFMGTTETSGSTTETSTETDNITTETIGSATETSADTTETTTETPICGEEPSRLANSAVVCIHVQTAVFVY